MTAPISRAFGAADMPRTIVLDPMLRAVADIPWDHPAGHAQTVRDVLDEPARGRRFRRRAADGAGADRAARVRLSALRLPGRSSTTSSAARIPAFCSTTPARPRPWSTIGSSAATISASRIRKCATPSAARSCAACCRRSSASSSSQATRMDRYIVACYDSAVGGHFYRHRDNVNVGAQHRRFAVTINLNNDYDGCDLMFPEFGRRTYRAPHGGAIVFSCGALHQVTPVTRGRRYAFLAFLYGEADAALRESNNAKHRAKRIPLQRRCPTACSRRRRAMRAGRDAGGLTAAIRSSHCHGPFPATYNAILGMGSPITAVRCACAVRLMTPTGRSASVGVRLPPLPAASQRTRFGSCAVTASLEDCNGISDRISRRRPRCRVAPRRQPGRGARFGTGFPYGTLIINVLGSLPWA